MNMTQVKLYGPLGSRFGREFQFMVSNVRDVMSALSTQLPGFKKYMMDAHHQGLTFAVFVGKRNIGKDELIDPTGGDQIRIVPIYQGSKRQGVLQTIIGVVLIVVGAVLSAYGFGAVGAPMIKFGISLAAGGIAQMLAPQPKGLGASDTPDNGASYVFNGGVNTQAQGNPVPAAYGECWAGSAIISGGIYAEDQQ